MSSLSACHQLWQHPLYAGAAVGAGGATAYYNKGAVGDAVREALTPSWLTASNSSGGSSDSNRQIDDLSKMVQQLSQDVRRGNGGITILRDTHRGYAD